MTNIWRTIALGDYEGHMALPQVGQAAALADELARLLAARRPASLALLGCAGGNGLERVDPACTRRTVAVDVNAEFVAAARARFGKGLPGLDVIIDDVGAGGAPPFAPVELVYAGLLLEYVPLAPAFAYARAALVPGGALATVVQRPSAALPEVTPSPFKDLERLAPHIRLVEPDAVVSAAAATGLSLVEARELVMPNGKVLLSQLFVAPGP